MTATWTKKGGSWQTKDGRWEADARWNTIQLDHWVLLIGGSRKQVASRRTLREIKEIVAEGYGEECARRMLASHDEWIELLWAKAAAAGAARSALKNGRARSAAEARTFMPEITTALRNRAELRLAVANQPGNFERRSHSITALSLDAARDWAAFNYSADRGWSIVNVRHQAVIPGRPEFAHYWISVKRKVER